MNEVQLIASEVATFYNSLTEAGVDPFTSANLTSTFIMARLQYGKYPEDSPIIPFQTGELDEQH